MELITPTKRGYSAKLGTTAVLLIESLRSPRIEHLRSTITSHEKLQKTVSCGELRAPRCPGFNRLVLHAPLHPRLRHRYRRTMKILLCVQQQYEVRIWLNKHKETCYKPSHRTTNKHGETRYRLNCHEERYNRKRILTHFLKDRNCEMQEGQNYLDSMQVTHGWSHTSSSKIWENW